MSQAPKISIVMPLHNDEEWVGNALESCLRQTLRDIEVVCVDDGSTDGTCAVVEAHQARDPRIRLIRMDANLSAFQARRRGVEEAAAPYVLFLDGDDELAPDAARATFARARAKSADIVAFGVDIVMPDGSTGGAFEASLQPVHRVLAGADILTSKFPPGRVAQGHLWCNLYRRDLLRDVYAGFPQDLTLFRANDIPITFLALAKANTYVSTPRHLYRYFFRRGRSGHRAEDLDAFRFYLGAIDSIECIDADVRAVAASRGDSTPIVASYESARLSIIGNVLKYCVNNVSEEIQADCLSLLVERVGEADVIRAAADFCESALPLLTSRASAPSPLGDPRRVVIATNDMRTGGLQGVVAAQARLLVQNGLSVTVAVNEMDGAVHDLPPGVGLVEIAGATRAEKLRSWLEVCGSHDLVIDHHILYNQNWPFFALIAQTIGVPTIGWLHNFALRTVYDFSTQGSFLGAYLPLLRTVVVLSTEDVSFWKLQGIEHVVWLPNPPSPMLSGLGARDARTPPTDRINLVWWGRLQQHTKQVRDLIAVAEHLRMLEVDFHLTIIGPDTADLSAADLLADATARGVADAVSLPGPLHGDELVRALSEAHLLLSTSVIEGNPLTLVEAQAMGLPVAMYELPWVESTKNNDGVSAVPQGSIPELARLVARISRDPAYYRALSEASITAAHRARTHDMSALYAQLLGERLPPEFSPEPSIDDASLLLKWMTFYSERNVRAQARLSRRLRARLAAELEATRRSFTFRVGRVVAFLPRQLARVVRLLSGAAGGPAMPADSARPGASPAELPPPPSPGARRRPGLTSRGGAGSDRERIGLFRKPGDGRTRGETALGDREATGSPNAAADMRDRVAAPRSN
ncbi:glycosyltransferase [Agromyces arachidis]|uniref:glycosyltransferase n=1 Tax=Agromyces arachidis TaxID=766966 RepID=UPI004056A217